MKICRKSFVYGFDLFQKNLDLAGLPYWFKIYQKGPGYFQVFLHFLLYMNCLSKTLITFKPDPPTLYIDPGVFAHLFPAASNFGRCPCVQQVQQSYQQRLWRWSSADLLRRRGFS